MQNFKIIITALILLFFGLIYSAPIAFAAPNVDKAIEDASWMMQAIVVGGGMDGALAHYIDKVSILPYQGNLAAIGLSRATQVSGDPTYVNAAWNHIFWYSNHMDTTTGYVTDYDLKNGVWTARVYDDSDPNNIKYPYDSTDSYAATFLLATHAAYRANSDITKLNSLHSAITNAVNAIHSTQRSDGLTWAVPQPTYHVKLLEDNVEAYQGLKVAVEMANILSDVSLSSNAQSYANSMATGIESLWNQPLKYYYWARHENGAQQAPNWSILSPDAMEEAWTVSFNAATGSRAKNLLSQFAAYQPNWDRPDLNGENYDIPIGWAYWRIGNPSRAQTAATNFRNYALSHNRAWPFNTKASGELIILETEGEGLLFP